MLNHWTIWTELNLSLENRRNLNFPHAQFQMSCWLSNRLWNINKNVDIESENCDAMKLWLRATNSIRILQNYRHKCMYICFSILCIPNKHVGVFDLITFEGLLNQSNGNIFVHNFLFCARLSIPLKKTRILIRCKATNIVPLKEEKTSKKIHCIN